MIDKKPTVDLEKIEVEQSPPKPKTLSELLEDRDTYFMRIGLLLYVRLFAFVVGVLMLALNAFIYLQDADIFKLVFTTISAIVPFIVVFLMTRLIKEFEAKIAEANESLRTTKNPD